jgi:CheY-like chemotaxis protein
MIAFPTLAHSRQEAQSTESLTKLHHVLVVDDEEHIALMLQEGLAKLPNCEITAATSSKQVLKLFAQRPFDLLITDYNMPGMDGLTLANQIRQRYPQTPVILLSAYADEVAEIAEGNESNESNEERECKAAIQHVLNKPVKLADIRHITLETLEKK